MSTQPKDVVSITLEPVAVWTEAELADAIREKADELNQLLVAAYRMSLRVDIRLPGGVGTAKFVAIDGVYRPV